jgi:eukaryotic-like serine/threonine-protein kinase
MTLSSGARLGPYEVLSRIGAGGMGEVWKARDTRLDRSVAVKILPAAFANDAHLKLRFEREAKTISQLQHPNICTLFDVGDNYLVMELLEGESLADRLARGPLPMPDVLRIGSQIADALDRAHRAGVVHRDLKPGNVMITRAGAKLLDFGLAKSGSSTVVDADQATQHKPLTQEGTILGTFQYMAPEQLAGEEADARSDIFALGAVLYEMTTGKRAFDGKTKTSLVSQIVAGQPRAVREMQPMTPAALEHVIRRCLEKERDDRWQSACDIAEELRWIAAEGGEILGAPAQRTTASRFLAGVAILSSLAAIVFATLFWNMRSTESPRFVSSLMPSPGTTFNFEAGAMVVSPDGRLLAVVANEADASTNLYIREFQTGKTRRLEGTKHATHPFWAPDNRSLGFFSGGKLKTIDIHSGTPETIADAGGARGGAWSEAGTIVYAPRFRDGLYVVPSSGGKPELLTPLAKGEVSHRWPAFLPDGDHVVFLAQRAEGGAADDPSTIDVVSLSSKDRKEVIRANSSVIYAPPGYLLFWREGSLLAQPFDARRLATTGSPQSVASEVSYSGTEQAIASASTNGTLVVHSGGKMSQSRLVVTARNGINRLAMQRNANYYGPSLSPDGKRVAVSVVDQTEDLLILDPERDTATRLTFDSGDEESPVWSPDGEWIAFRSNRKDTGDVYRIRASGAGQEEPVFVSPEGTRPTSWSPDGKHLLLEVTQERRDVASDIWIYSFESRKAEPLVQTPFSEGGAVFSPDGRSIAYTSDESGKAEVYVRSLKGAGNGAGKWQVSANGGAIPRWRNDGRELYFVATGDALMVVKVSGVPVPVFSRPELLFAFRQKVRPIKDNLIPTYDVRPGGQEFVLNSVTVNTDAPITVTQNWLGGLRNAR